MFVDVNFKLSALVSFSFGRESAVGQERRSTDIVTALADKDDLTSLDTLSPNTLSMSHLLYHVFY